MGTSMQQALWFFDPISFRNWLRGPPDTQWLTMGAACSSAFIVAEPLRSQRGYNAFLSWIVRESFMLIRPSTIGRLCTGYDTTICNRVHERDR